MSAEPWKKWTPDFLHEAAIDARNHGFPPWAEMLEALAELLEAEQRGERCVLPPVFGALQISAVPSINGPYWLADCRAHVQGKGETKESAILDLARKLRGE